jgi:hypothetical protein
MSAIASELRRDPRVRKLSLIALTDLAARAAVVPLAPINEDGAAGMLERVSETGSTRFWLAPAISRPRTDRNARPVPNPMDAART